MKITDLFDRYSLQARMQPALYALFPLILTIAIWFPEIYQVGIGLVTLFVTCGVVVMLANIARYLGRRAEVRLYKEWGGKPTTQWLKHRDSCMDSVTKLRYHRALEHLVPGWKAPSPAEESTDPIAANSAYDAAVIWLREHTRDTNRFTLLFKENIAYGFARNVFGLKTIGIFIAVVSAIINLALIFGESPQHIVDLPPSGITSGVISIGVLVTWIVFCTKNWVREAADGYARALLAACDVLSQNS